MIGGDFGGGGRGGHRGRRGNGGRRRWRRRIGLGCGLGFGFGFGLCCSLGGRGDAVADLAEQRPGADRLAILGDDFGEDPGRRRIDFEGHLVGFEFDDGLVRKDLLARLLEPPSNCRFGDRFTQGRHADFSCHLSCSKPSGFLWSYHAENESAASQAAKTSSMKASICATCFDSSPGRRGRGGGPARIERALAFAARLRQHPFKIRIDEVPGAHVLRFFLTPVDPRLREPRQR